MGYPSDYELPVEVTKQIRAVQHAVHTAAEQAISDCPDVVQVRIEISVRLSPLNFPIAFTVENKD